MTLLEFFLSWPGMDKILFVEGSPDTTVIRLDAVEGYGALFRDPRPFSRTFEATSLYMGIRDRFVPCWGAYGGGYRSTEYYLDDEALKTMREIQVTIDESMEDWDPIYKYPFYKAVGSPIPQGRLEGVALGHLSPLTKPDGKIDFISNTMKWPDTEEMFWELLDILLVYPQLDVMIAVLYWEGDDDEQRRLERELKRELKKDPDLISIGFWVHDRTIEILDPEHAKQKLIEYESRGQT